MTSIFLTITDLFLTMGMPPIDEHLHMIINKVQDFNIAGLNEIKAISKIVGCGLALCMASYESYMMILGRRGLDIMRILRIIAFSFCITSTNFIIYSTGLLGNAFANQCQVQMQIQNQSVEAELRVCSNKQRQYCDSLRARIDTLTERAKQQLIMDQHAGDDDGWIDDMVVSIKQSFASAQGEIKKFVVSAETLVSEAVNEGIRFLGEVVFEVAFFGIILAATFMMKVLQAFCPLAFAISIIPPWASAWSQWISKYVSISLWAGLSYCCVIFIDFILLYEISTDITAYDTLLGQNPLMEGTWQEVAQLGLQNIGATCRYVIALIIGAIVLKFVPEIASWIVPGGASSSIGSAMGGLAMSAGMAGAAGAYTIAKGGSKIAIGGSSIAMSNAPAAANAGAGAVMGASAGAVKGFQSGAAAGLQYASKAGGNTVQKLIAMSMLGAAGTVGGGMEGGMSGFRQGAYDKVKRTASSLSGKVKAGPPKR